MARIICLSVFALLVQFVAFHGQAKEVYRDRGFFVEGFECIYQYCLDTKNLYEYSLNGMLIESSLSRAAFAAEFFENGNFQIVKLENGQKQIVADNLQIDNLDRIIAIKSDWMYYTSIRSDKQLQLCRISLDSKEVEIYPLVEGMFWSNYKDDGADDVLTEESDEWLSMPPTYTSIYDCVAISDDGQIAYIQSHTAQSISRSEAQWSWNFPESWVCILQKDGSIHRIDQGEKVAWQGEDCLIYIKNDMLHCYDVASGNITVCNNLQGEAIEVNPLGSISLSRDNCLLAYVSPYSYKGTCVSIVTLSKGTIERYTDIPILASEDIFAY